MTGPPPRLQAAGVPALRRQLADWYGGPQGAQSYHQAIALGQQALRPPGPPQEAAAQLAAAETARLRDGDLWYVGEDLCALLNAAHPSMPAFAPRPDDLPSQTGFAVFAEPIAMYPAEATLQGPASDLVDALAAGDEEFREIADRMYGDSASIVAASWGPADNPHWQAGGVWMSFYATSQLHFSDILRDDPETARRAQAMLPPLTVDNEAAIAWRPDGAPADRYQLPPGDPATAGTVIWARLVFAAFQLAAQANLAETEPQPTARPERRRTERAGLPERDVRIIRLRRGLAGPPDDSQPPGEGSREWQHRWVVRGHWRNQWYPTLGDHRPKWIAPYLKGPDDAPLLGGEKVTVITAPPPDPED